MASGWDPGTKSVIRFNSRNHGPTIWEEDAIAAQAIDPEGHDVNDQTLADSITETLNINGINNMLADLNLGGFKAVGMAAGVAATDGANLAQVAAAVASGIAAAGGGIRWTQVEVSTTLALGNRFAALSFGSTIVWTLPAISGALPLSGPNDIWIFNGDANNDIQLDPLAGIGGRIYWNGQDLGLSTNILIQPGQMAIIVPVGASEANAWNVHTTNSGDRTPYGVAWDGSNRPPSQHEVYQQLVSAFNQIAAKVPNTGNTTIAGVKTFSSDPIVPSEAYGIGWSGSNEPPTKGDTYTKIQSIVAGTGTAWLIKNASFAPAYGGFYASFSHAGYSITLPAGIATPGVFPNSLVMLNCDISGANTITINPPSLGVIYLEGVSLGVDVGYPLLQGEMATIITVGTDIYLLHVS